MRGGVDTNPRDNPLPPYWEAPARGLSPQRVRSRSPIRNVAGYQKDDDSDGLPKDKDYSE